MTNFPARRAVLRLGWILGLAALSGIASAAYPERPIRLVIGTTVGGISDSVARILADRATAELGVPVIVEAKPGASGNLAMDHVAKSAADGYTLFVATSPNITINPGLYPNLPFNVDKDFRPVSIIAGGGNILVVNPKLPVKNLAELIAYAKANPGKLTYGSSGNGSTQHLAGELLAKQANIKLLHVPYRGGAQATMDVIGGQISMMFTDSSQVPQIRSGNLRALAWAGRRARALPDLPTMSEAGLASFRVEGFYAVMAPAGISEEILNRLNATFDKIAADPGVVEKLSAIGLEPVPRLAPAPLQQLIRDETRKWGEIIRENNISIN